MTSPEKLATPDPTDAEFVRMLLWDTFPECCGSPVVGAEYMGQQEQVCCGCPEPASLNDAQIVASLRARFPEQVGLATQRQGEGEKDDKPGISAKVEARKPTGFVATCQCGKDVGALDYDRSPREDVARLLGRWLAHGCTVTPKFAGTWSAQIEQCECLAATTSKD